MDDLIRGFECECGEYHAYPAYVFAHYDFDLAFTCPKCGAEYSVLSGIARKKSSHSIESKEGI